jgi:hypothetical protein
MASAETTYSRSLELPPLRLSHLDFFDTITRIRDFRNTDGPDTAYIRENLTARRDELEVELDGTFSEGDLASLPRVVDEVRYHVYGEGGVASVVIDLEDDRRWVAVQGSASEQVDALAALIEKDLREHSHMLGGPRVRSLSYLTLFFSGMAFVFIGGLLFNRGSVSKPGYAAILVLSVLGMAAAFVVLTSPWPPGFAMFQDTPGFLSRHSALFTFIALIIAVVGGVMSAAKALLRKGAN